jgi:rhodanese-related sulfurtransferase
MQFLIASAVCALAAAVALGTWCPSHAHEQTQMPFASFSAASLSNVLKGHTGPVLDVRMAGDCNDDRTLKRTTNRIGFDFGQDGADGKRMAHDMFLSRVQASKNLMSAKRSGQTIVIVCCAGGRSEAAASLLAANGFKAAHVPGGTQNPELPVALLKIK